MKPQFAIYPIALLIVGSGTAQASQPIFPAEVADSVWWTDLAEEEPPLWRPVDRVNHRSRVRLSISGISTLRVIIRIDEDLRGRFRGRALLIKRRGGRSTDVTERRFTPTIEQMAHLRAKITEAKLWTMYPEHWIGGENDICVDGEQMVFERADGEGYRFSEANAQCTAPAPLLEVARMMIGISGVPRGVAELLN